MQKARRCAFGVATEEKIFLSGGTVHWQSWETCEMFIISSNQWQLIGSLTVGRQYGRMVCLKGTLYVLGGIDQYFGGSQLSVECYDPIENKWIQKTTIPVKMISKDNNNKFTGCVLKLSKGVLDKLDVIEK